MIENKEQSILSHLELEGASVERQAAVVDVLSSITGYQVLDNITKFLPEEELRQLEEDIEDCEDEEILGVLRHSIPGFDSLVLNTAAAVGQDIIEKRHHIKQLVDSPISVQSLTGEDILISEDIPPFAGEEFLNQEEWLLNHEVANRRAHYITSLLDKDELSRTDIEVIRGVYMQALAMMVMHQCRSELMGKTVDHSSHDQAERLLEVVTATVLQEASARQAYVKELEGTDWKKRVQRFLSTNQLVRYAVSTAAATTAIVTAHTGVLPDHVSSYVEPIAVVGEAGAQLLGVRAAVNNLLRRRQVRDEQKELQDQIKSMANNPTAAEHYVEFECDNIPLQYRPLYLEAAKKAKTGGSFRGAALVRVIEAVDQAVADHAQYPHDMQEIADFIKLYYKDILPDGGLLEQLEKDPYSNVNGIIILAILRKQLLKEESKLKDHNRHQRIAIAIGAVVGAATLGGGIELQYHPMDSPLKDLSNDD